MTLDKTHLATLAVGAVLAVGAPAAYRAAVPAASAQTITTPMTLMWTNEGAGRSPRFVLTPSIQNGDGGDIKPTEIECEHDGTAPKIHNQLVERDENLIGICTEIAKFDTAVQPYLQAAAPTLLLPVALADMAQPPADLAHVDAGQ